MKLTKETRKRKGRDEERRKEGKEDLVRVSWRSADVVFLLDTVGCEHVCLSFHPTDFILEVLIHISTTLTLMLVQLVQTLCDWCGPEYRAVCCTHSVTETLWFCSHDSVFRNILTERKVTQDRNSCSHQPPSAPPPRALSALPSLQILSPALRRRQQAAGWEVGGKLSQVPSFDHAVAAFVLQAKTLPQTCTNTSTALLVFKVTPTDMLPVFWQNVLP